MTALGRWRKSVYLCRSNVRRGVRLIRPVVDGHPPLPVVHRASRQRVVHHHIVSALNPEYPDHSYLQLGRKRGPCQGGTRVGKGGGQR